MIFSCHSGDRSNEDEPQRDKDVIIITNTRESFPREGRNQDELEVEGKEDGSGDSGRGEEVSSSGNGTSTATTTERTIHGDIEVEHRPKHPNEIEHDEPEMVENGKGLMV